MTASFLITKLCAPQLRSKLVRRSNLLDKLESGLNAGSRLTLVSAPVGYGKTTLIAEWLKGRKYLFTWFSLDEGDNDPIRFLTYLIAALQRIDSNIGHAAQNLLCSPRLPPIDMTMDTLVNDIAILTKPFILVLDDYHVIHTELIHQAVQYLLDYQPPSSHMVIMTREDPPLSIARLRARGQITEIRVDDLRFASEETTDFFKHTMNLNLDAEAAAVLEKRTEGWIAGLQLAGLSMKDRSEEYFKSFIMAFSGSQRYIIDYLADEVLSRLDHNLKEFLYQTSILDRFTAPLCDAVTGRSDSRTILTMLEKANLFVIPLDEHRQWYRYHNLFADILRSEPERRQQELLHGKAAQWLEDNNLMEEAVRHAMAAGNTCEVERLVIKTAVDMIQKGAVRTLLGWIETLPAKNRLENYELAIYRAWCLFMMGQSREAVSTLACIDEDTLVQAKPAVKGSLLVLQTYMLISFEAIPTLYLSREALGYINHSDPLLRVSALHCTGQMRMFEGNMNGAIESFREAYLIGHRTGQDFFAVISLKNLAMNLLLQGKRREAEACCLEAISRYVDGSGNLLPVAGVLYIPLGIASFTCNDIQETQEYLDKGLAVCRQLSLPYFIIQGELTMASLRCATGDVQGALAIIRNVSGTVAGLILQGAISLFAAVEAEFLLKQGDLDTATRWAEGSGFSTFSLPNHVNEREFLIYVRVIMANKRFQDAQVSLAALERTIREGGRYYRLISVHILQALVFKALGFMEEAAKYLEYAVSLAAPEDSFRQFLDEDPSVAGLLPAVRSKEPAFVDNLLGQYKISYDSEKYPGELSQRTAAEPVTGVQKNDRLAEPLSEREKQILGLIADGLSNLEISRKLYITLGTTKWHISNIFSKLGVSRRTQALERARKLNLL